MTPLSRTPLLLVVALILSACTGAQDTPPQEVASASEATPAAQPVDASDAPGVQPRQMLRPFDSCDALLSYYVDNARELVGPYGLGHGGGFGGGEIATMEMMDEEESSASAAVAQDSGAVSGSTDGVFSGTNNQEAGVDEPDVVKTDGQIIVTSLGDRVQIVDATTPGPTPGGDTVSDTPPDDTSPDDTPVERPIAEIPLPPNVWNAELLLNGTTLLILAADGTGGAFGPADGSVPAFPATRTTVMRYDLSDPTSPRALGGVRMEGSYRSARMIGDTVRLAMVSDPTGLAFIHPDDSGLSAEQDAVEANRQILADSDIDDWVPHLQQIGPDGQAGDVTRLSECTSIQSPPDFAGLSTVSVVTFDVQDTEAVIAPTSSAGVVAAGDTVYASTDRLILATSPWGPWTLPFAEQLGTPDDGLTTSLHSFDISDPAATRYVASGTVEGTLIGQFALSEINGVTRVATTQNPQWFGTAEGESSSSLIVLAEEDGELVETGRVDDLGVTEQIQSVRYLGPDVAAIVTFRQTDPLYLIDTSDSAAPALLGELKIPGFSSYLHPVGEGYLIGVGQDADTETGQTLGLQVSLFDIRDLSSPQRVAQVDFEGEGYSPAEHDHRAFLYWAATGQIILPAELFPTEGVLRRWGRGRLQPTVPGCGDARRRGRHPDGVRPRPHACGRGRVCPEHRAHHRGRGGLLDAELRGDVPL